MKIDEAVEILTRHIEHTGSVLAEDTPYVVAALAEVEQLKDVLAWQEQRNAMNVKTLTAEVEWLRTLQKKESDIYRRNVEEIEQMRAKIDKALKTAPKHPDRVYHRNFPVYIQAMVKALGGEK